MEKYLLFFDLDNTILTKKKQIKYSTIRGVQRLIKLGHIVCISTGRSFESSISFYNKLKLTSPLVTVNGAVIYHPDGKGDFTPEEFPMELDGFLYLIKNLGHGLYSGKVYSQNTYVYNLEDINNLFFPGGFPAEYKNCNLLTDLKENPVASYLRIQKSHLEIFGRIAKEMNFAYSIWKDNGWLVDVELSSSIGTKGGALKNLGARLGATKIIAFGDALNDISMLEVADIGVAMCNANEKVKSVTPFATYKDFEHNGAVSYACQLVKGLMRREKEYK